jgi:hypothetical protein
MGDLMKVAPSSLPLLIVTPEEPTQRETTQETIMLDEPVGEESGVVHM